MEQIISMFKDIGLTDTQIESIKQLGYFTSPASSSRHSSFKGGLAQHSLNVTTMMLDINDRLNLGLDRNMIIMAGLFHDLDKVGFYKENILKSGQVSESIPYKRDVSIGLSHPIGSLYLLQDIGIKVPVPVAVAIVNHGGMYDSENFKYIQNVINNQPIDMILVWLIQTCDTYCAWIKEK